MKKFNVTGVGAFIIIVLFVFVIGFGSIALGLPRIGSVHGAELERITIDGVNYLAEDFIGEATSFSAADRGRYLGSVSNEKSRLRVFTVTGDADRSYIYVLNGWDGDIYIREDAGN